MEREMSASSQFEKFVLERRQDRQSRTRSHRQRDSSGTRSRGRIRARERAARSVRSHRRRLREGVRGKNASDALGVARRARHDDAAGQLHPGNQSGARRRDGARSAHLRDGRGRDPQRLRRDQADCTRSSAPAACATRRFRRPASSARRSARRWPGRGRFARSSSRASSIARSIRSATRRPSCATCRAARPGCR